MTITRSKAPLSFWVGVWLGFFLHLPPFRWAGRRVSQWAARRLARLDREATQ